MAAWKRLGELIAHNMIVIIPICLVFGICLPGAFQWMRPAVTPLFAFVTFQGSLGNNFRNLAETFRHPLPMVAAMVISQVICPLVGWAGGSLLFHDQAIVTGLVLQYSVPIAVTSTMWVGIFEGNMPLALGTLLISTVLAPLTIPATLQLLMGATVAVDALGMIRDVMLTVAIPALVGTLINDRTDGRAKRELSPVLAPLARIFVVLIITINSTSLHDFMFNLTGELVGVMVFVAFMITLSYALGLAGTRLLRLDRASSVTLVFCSALKNISVGAVVALNYFTDATMFPVMISTLFNQVLAATYGRLLGRLLGEAPSGSQAPSEAEDAGARTRHHG